MRKKSCDNIIPKKSPIDWIMQRNSLWFFLGIMSGHWFMLITQNGPKWRDLLRLFRVNNRQKNIFETQISFNLFFKKKKIGFNLKLNVFYSNYSKIECFLLFTRRIIWWSQWIITSYITESLIHRWVLFSIISRNFINIENLFKHNKPLTFFSFFVMTTKLHKCISIGTYA